MKHFATATLCLFFFWTGIQAQTRWQIEPNGSIAWHPRQDIPHDDHIEMSGKRVSVVLRYGINAQGTFHVNQSMVWPMLRTIPNNTHASLMRRFDWNALEGVMINEKALGHEQVRKVSFDGTLCIESTFRTGNAETTLLRQYFPSTERPALIERFTIVNSSSKAISVELMDKTQALHTNPQKGVEGSYLILLQTSKGGCHHLQPGDSLHFSATIAAYRQGEKPYDFNTDLEWQNRMSLVHTIQDNLILRTPDEAINHMFSFAKLRASESIYETKQGPVHGPGGESFYAAIWANDQAEYVNPFFPFLGYDYANAASLNSFEWFKRYMNDNWRPIPSSIIAEGTDVWQGAGDRGDAAMIAYGAARYALASGSLEEARQLWPLITWCLEYCRRKLNAEGVVNSDSDELEGRFPSGKANLCTSSLYYDALISATYLCQVLHEPSNRRHAYAKQAADLRKNIDRYFAHEMDDFDTYQYFQGNDKLRSWICIPLCMGITERAKGTIDALFSPQLWTKNGLLTQAGSQTFWDRTTLYALRGVFAAGYPDKANEYLHYYSQTRLLGEHVPYAIEAWPEGNQRHLSAESGLYARIITEGLFGMRPTGLHRFQMKPEMPSAWNHMSLQHIRAFGSDFSIDVTRAQGGKLRVSIAQEGRKPLQYHIKQGEQIDVSLT